MYYFVILYYYYISIMDVSKKTSNKVEFLLLKYYCTYILTVNHVVEMIKFENVNITGKNNKILQKHYFNTPLSFQYYLLFILYFDVLCIVLNILNRT